MISSLHRTILRIHTMYAAERRDFILIQHMEEELANELVPGVNIIYIYFILPMLYLASIK